MHFTGTLKSWNNDRGFGFVEPTHGGQEIFVHIEAFHEGTCTSRANSQFLALQLKARMEGLEGLDTPVYGLAGTHHAR